MTISSCDVTTISFEPAPDNVVTGLANAVTTSNARCICPGSDILTRRS